MPKLGASTLHVILPYICEKSILQPLGAPLLHQIRGPLMDSIQLFCAAPPCVRFWIITEHVINTLEDRKYGYFWIFPHHSCENIQNYFEFLDTFGYSPIIPEPVSKI